MSKSTPNTGALGGRTDPTTSTAVWRCHKRLSPRSYLRCVECDSRTRLRLRRADGSIEPLCSHHFAAVVDLSEARVKQLVAEDRPDR